MANFEFFDKYVDNFTLWASPPDKVVAGCPSFIYPSPTSLRVWSFEVILVNPLKWLNAVLTVIFNTCAMFWFRNSISNASELYRLPKQESQGTVTSGKNCISIWIYPSPSHDSHLPPLTLKENLPGL